MGKHLRVLLIQEITSQKINIKLDNKQLTVSMENSLVKNNLIQE